MRALATLQRRRWYRRLARRLVGRLEVREATTAEDLEIRERWPLEGHAASGPHSQVTTYIALAGKHIAGWYHLQRGDSEAQLPGFVLNGLYVRWRYRGLGLARCSMQTLMERAADESAQHVLLVVDTNNTPAITLYQSMGFVVAEDGPWATWMEEIERRYGVTQVVMRLSLRG
jgi:ribosomal protein S18 acetylase RimI-like enzyme